MTRETRTCKLIGRRGRTPAGLFVLMALGCSSPANTIEPDAAQVDAALADAAPDSGAPDSGATGFGTLSSGCALASSELTSSSSSYFALSIDFEGEYSEEDLGLLSTGAQEILADGTAGGSSGLSEAFAFDVLHRCNGAELLRSETEIVYDTEGKKTDFSAQIFGETIGASVTRAVAFPFEQKFSVADARVLLEGKLSDILESSANVSKGDRWRKQILVVMAYGPQHEASLQSAFAEVDTETRADSVVYVVVTNGSDDFIYCNGPCQN